MNHYDQKMERIRPFLEGDTDSTKEFARLFDLFNQLPEDQIPLNIKVVVYHYTNFLRADPNKVTTEHLRAAIYDDLKEVLFVDHYGQDNVYSTWFTKKQLADIALEHSLSKNISIVDALADFMRKNLDEQDRLEKEQQNNLSNA